MPIYTLRPVLVRKLAGAVAKLDGHPIFGDTMGGQIHLAGFTSRGACLACKYRMPVTLKGAAPPLTISTHTCHATATRSANEPKPGE